MTIRGIVFAGSSPKIDYRLENFSKAVLRGCGMPAIAIDCMQPRRQQLTEKLGVEPIVDFGYCYMYTPTVFDAVRLVYEQRAVLTPIGPRYVFLVQRG